MDSMLDTLDRVHTGEQDPFELYEGHGKLTLFDVFETICESGDGAEAPLETMNCHRVSIEADDDASLEHWLSLPDVSEGQKTRIRLLIVPSFVDASEDQKKLGKPDGKSVKRAFDAFGLPYSTVESLRLVSSEFLTFPTTNDVGENRTKRSTFCYSQGWWNICWTRHESEGITKAILLMDKDHGVPINRQFAHKLKTLKHLAAQPCLLGLVVAVVALTQLSRYVFTNEANDGRADTALGKIGLRTQPRADEYAAISRNISVRAYFTSTHRIRLHTLKLLLESLAHESRLPAGALSDHQAETIAQCFTHLQQKANSSILLAEHLKDRADMHLASLFNIIAQTSQSTSIDIAKSTAKVALESKLDSTAMKTIAAVTMIFLPGTFVATLFATPVFHWDQATGFGVAPQIWVYWAITIPLTFLTVAVWWLWLSLKNRAYSPARGMSFKMRRRREV